MGKNLYTLKGAPEAFATTLLELLTDPELAAKMGYAGLNRVDEFSARKMVRDIAALYERLLTEFPDGF